MKDSGSTIIAIIFILIVIFWLSSCSSSLDEDYRRINPILSPYVKSFVLEAKQRNIIIDTTYLKIDTLSIPQYGISNDYYILIQTDFVNKYPPYSNKVEILVFHELAHHYLHKPHYDDSPDIMNTVLDITLYRKYSREQILNQLFNQ